MKRYLLDIIMAAGILVSMALGFFADFSEKAEQVQGEVLRLHIPANSDSERDQQIKLALRDALLEEYGIRLASSGSLSEAEENAAALLPEIEQFANAFLKERGADYTASAELTEMYFTTREYERVTLPAGNYRALRITLGSGEGHNWWCIMFPPLCIPCVSRPLTAEEESAETPDAQTEQCEESVLACFEKPKQIKVKFAVYEWIKSLMSN